MKRIALAILAAFIPVVLLGILFPEKLFQQSAGVHGRDPGADIVAYVRDGCPHCADFEEFADEQGWRVDYREVTDPDSAEAFADLQRIAPTLPQGVPTIIVDGQIMYGYETDETTGTFLLEQYTACQDSEEGCVLYDEFVVSSSDVSVRSASQAVCTEDCEVDFDKFVLDVWFVGEVDLTVLSLPALSILLGFLDGFNPCAMWVLITLLTLLINTHDMRKVWIVGGTFLIVSGAVYYLLIAAWLNIFLLIGINRIVQFVIGIVAIGGGGFYLYEAFGKDPNACNVTDAQTRKRTIDRMRSILQITYWPAMIVGVAVLAISVNMIELVCTAGLPAIFTQILAFNDVSDLGRYGYIGLYILLYMIDDFVIFAIAVSTLHATGLTTKYRRLTLIVGGLLMYALGVLMLFWPNALVFA